MATSANSRVRWLATAVACAAMGMVAGDASAQPATATGAAAGYASAPPAAALNGEAATLKARIAQLPASTIDLRTQPPSSVVRPLPPSASASSARWATSIARPSAPVGAASGGTPASGTARYVPLPPEEARAAQALLTRQLDSLKPVNPGQPAFTAFKGAVVTQASGSGEVTLIPLVLVDSPLRFNPARRLYEGSIAVGLIELGYMGPAKTLSAPIRFQVLGDATADPSISQVASTSPPFTTVRVSARDVRAALDLQVASNVNAEPVKLTLPVKRAQLELRAKTRLQGWGLESTEVTVAATDSEASKGSLVVLEAPLGNLTPQRVTLTDQGDAQAVLRSESTGRIQLTATGASLEPATLMIDYEFPTRFLLAALGGGLVGGLLRTGGKHFGDARRFAWNLLLGVLTGALVFGLFALGINVVGFPLPRVGGEALVGVVSALGAFFGTGVLAPARARR